CSGGPGARPTRALLQEPRVHGLAAKPDIVQRQGTHAQLRDEHGASRSQALYNGRILQRHTILEGLGTIRGADAGGVEEVLGAPRNAVQRTAVSARGDLPVRRPRVFEREVTREGDHAAQTAIPGLDATKVELSQPLRLQLPRAYPAGKL